MANDAGQYLADFYAAKTDEQALAAFMMLVKTKHRKKGGDYWVIVREQLMYLFGNAMAVANRERHDQLTGYINFVMDHLPSHE